MKLDLRALNPETNLDLYQEAYGWRTKRKTHIQPDRMPFEEFAKADPSQIVMGLFNGEFLAAYLIKEYDYARFDMHFTSRKGAPREYLVSAGITLTDWLIDEGALEVSAVIVSRNRALRQFLEDCGYHPERKLSFRDNNNQEVAYVRYVAGLKRIKTGTEAQQPEYDKLGVANSSVESGT